MASFFDILSWDGTHIGDITNDISFHPVEKSQRDTHIGDLATYRNTTILVLNFDDKFPLIIDELKDTFSLTRMFYHQCTIENKEYTICRQWDCDTTLALYSQHPDHFPETPFFIMELRRIFAFRSVFFLSFNNDTSIYVKPLGVNLYNKDIQKNTALPISRIETKYNITKQVLDSVNNISSRFFKTHGSVPKHIITKYFNNDYDMFYDEVVKIRSEISAIDIKYKMHALIKKYEPDNFIDWVNAVYLNWEI